MNIFLLWQSELIRQMTDVNPSKRPKASDLLNRSIFNDKDMVCFARHVIAPFFFASHGYIADIFCIKLQERSNSSIILQFLYASHTQCLFAYLPTVKFG